jgi:hypothetical protein
VARVRAPGETGDDAGGERDGRAAMGERIGDFPPLFDRARG